MSLKVGCLVKSNILASNFSEFLSFRHQTLLYCTSLLQCSHDISIFVLFWDIWKVKMIKMARLRQFSPSCSAFGWQFQPGELLSSCLSFGQISGSELRNWVAYNKISVIKWFMCYYSLVSCSVAKSEVKLQFLFVLFRYVFSYRWWKLLFSGCIPDGIRFGKSPRCHKTSGCWTDIEQPRNLPRIYFRWL